MEVSNDQGLFFVVCVFSCASKWIVAFCRPSNCRRFGTPFYEQKVALENNVWNNKNSETKMALRCKQPPSYTLILQLQNLCQKKIGITTSSLQYFWFYDRWIFVWASCSGHFVMRMLATKTYLSGSIYIFICNAWHVLMLFGFLFSFRFPIVYSRRKDTIIEKLCLEYHPTEDPLLKTSIMRTPICATLMWILHEGIQHVQRAEERWNPGLRRTFWWSIEVVAPLSRR